MNASRIEKIATLPFPSLFGELVLTVYKTKYENQPDMKYVLVMHGNKIAENPLIRMHSSCLFGDTLGSMYCDCREQLDTSMDLISKANGILFYLDQEGRGHGLFNKVKEMKLQIDEGLDTVEASERLHLKADSRDFSVIADILNLMNISSVKILTNNPDKLKSLKDGGIKVERVSLETKPNQHNAKYQSTKKAKFNHLFSKYI